MEQLASGSTPQEILEGYPHITTKGLAAALHYAAQALKNEVIWQVKIPA